jgi:hypothetical protein
MDMAVNKVCLALVLAVIISFQFVQTFSVYADNSLAQKRTLSLLSDVLMLDLTSYDVVLRDNRIDYPTEYGGLSEEIVRYFLYTDGSKLDITCKYVNGTFISCIIEVLERSKPTIYREPQPTDILEVAKGFLKRFQKWSGSARYQELENVLGMVYKLENTIVRLNNLRLSVFVEGKLVHFGWTHIYKFGEYEFEVDGLFLDFIDGDLWGFGDCYSIYRVGSVAVKVSRDEAVRMARERAKTFYWKVGLGSNATEVKDFKILEEPVKTSLSLRMREPLTLYPHWQVVLYFDKTYPGFVIGVEVGIWADKGEIHYINPISTGGGLPPQDSSTPSPEPEPAPSPQPSPQPNFSGTGIPIEYRYAIIAVTIFAIAAASSYLYIKSKRDRNKT